MQASDTRWERRQTERRLAEKMNHAFNQYLEASAVFTRLVNDVPSGALQSDGVTVAQRLHVAGERQKQALKTYHRALEDFTEFVIHGIVPPPEE